MIYKSMVDCTLPMGSPAGVNGIVPPDMSPPVQESIDKRRQDEAGPSIPNRPRNSDRGMEHLCEYKFRKLVISIRSNRLLLGLVAKCLSVKQVTQLVFVYNIARVTTLPSVKYGRQEETWK